MNSNSIFRAALGWCLWLSLAFSTWAQVPVDVGPGKAPEVKISTKDFNRIAVFDGRIKTIKFKAGDLDVNPEEVTGSLLVLPNVTGNITTYVITASGQAHQLTLVPSAIGAQTIVLREPKLDSKGETKQASGNEPKYVSQRVDRANSYDVAIKRIVGAMARNEKLADLRYQEFNKEFQLWQGSRLWLISRYSGQTYSGEHYRIQNTSGQLMRMDEREFYKPGVLAVSIEIHELGPDEATDIFVVRESTDGK